MFKWLSFGPSKDPCQTCFRIVMKFKLLLTTYSYVWGETDEQHDKHLKQVLERAQQQNLKLNKS